MFINPAADDGVDCPWAQAGAISKLNNSDTSFTSQSNLIIDYGTGNRADARAA